MLKRVIKWSLGALIVVLIATALIAYWTSTNDCGRNTPAESPRMKAVVYCDYGSPNVLRLKEIRKPTPADNEVLVRVHAASINPLDWHFMEGTPYVGRLAMGLRKPKATRLGVDYAGTVEAVGRNVNDFKVGDEVFGGKGGALAQYVCVRTDRAVVPKPGNLTLAEAASIPVAGITALQALRDKAKVQRGQKVLINGASGGVGTFAVQIARAFGAEVTGVCSTRNLDLVRSIGAAHVIDYTKEDFTKAGLRYDLIVDMVGNHGLLECRRALTSSGKYIMIGGPSGRWIAPLDTVARAFLLSPFLSQEMGFFLAQLKKEDLLVLRDLIQTGKVTPVIDRTYNLSEIPAAIRYLQEGHARGKVVLTVD